MDTPQPVKDPYAAPPFWVTTQDGILELLAGLKSVSVTEIGRSAGGRPLLAASWGEFEPVRRTSESFNSAQGGRKLKAFFGERPRSRPVVAIQCAIHGMEIEGTVAALNMLSVLDRGADLRGRQWPLLREAIQGFRVVVIPLANPDGRARCPIMNEVLFNDDEHTAANIGRWKDGKLCTWPFVKQVFPIPADDLATTGGYFNGAGVNLAEDRFLHPDRAPETDALLGLYHREMPDAVLILHTDDGSLVQTPSNYVPAVYQHQQTRLAAHVAAHVRQGGGDKFGMGLHGVPLDVGRGPHFDQADAVYHVCGALPLMIELPHGSQTRPMAQETILDVCLLALEAVFTFGKAYGLRPRYDPFGEDK